MQTGKRHRQQEEKAWAAKFAGRMYRGGQIRGPIGAGERHERPGRQRNECQSGENREHKRKGIKCLNETGMMRL